MTQTVIDTLQLADRLKESGFEDRQAEGLARALGGAFTDHVVTKADLDSAIQLVDSAIQLVRADYRALDEKTDALDTKFEAKFDALDAKFNALSAQIKFIFAVLAALLALGLIDTAARLLG